jgi:hypothetical protein
MRKEEKVKEMGELEKEGLTLYLSKVSFVGLSRGVGTISKSIFKKLTQ